MKFVPGSSSKMKTVSMMISLSTAVNAFLLSPPSPPSPTATSPVSLKTKTTIHKEPPSALFAESPSSTNSFSSADPVKINKSYQKVFDFTNSSYNTIEKFDRIDDVIMGGISTSTLRQQDNESFSRWSGICREDGGGFCGIRTLPFQEPLTVDSATASNGGLYVKCRFTSDDEPERRVWKVTTRTDTSRGEQLYQAMITIPKKEVHGDDDDDEWVTVHVPFTDFKFVSGARLIADVTSTMDVTGGLYQIGMVMSKFTIAKNMTSIENFRPGYFELQISEIGLYNDAGVESKTEEQKGEQTESKEKIMDVLVLSKDEASKRLPLILKILRPVSKLFFSEKSQRRKSAMRILTKERNITRLQAIKYGLIVRAKTNGWIPSIFQTLGILGIDTFRKVVFTTLQFVLIKPIVLTRKLLLGIKNVLAPSKKVAKKDKEALAAAE